jgi:hypothetical protein
MSRCRKPWPRLESPFSPRSSFWRFSSGSSPTVPGCKLKKFPGGAKGLVIAAILVVGIEVLALGIFGVKAWANVYLTPPAADAMPIQVQAGQFAFYFRYPGPDGKFGATHPETHQ